MIMAALFITDKRLQYIDLTKPWLDLGMTVMIPKQIQLINMWAFWDPFEHSLWGAVIGAFIVTALVTTLCNYLRYADILP